MIALSAMAQNKQTSKLAGYTVSMPEGWKMKVAGDDIEGVENKTETIDFENENSSNLKLMVLQKSAGDEMPDDKEELHRGFLTGFKSGLGDYGFTIDFKKSTETHSSKEFYTYKGDLMLEEQKLGESTCYFYSNEKMMFVAIISFILQNEADAEEMMKGFKKAAATLEM